MSLVPEPLIGSSPYKPEGRASRVSGADAKKAKAEAQQAAQKAYLETFSRGDEYDRSVFVNEQSTGVRVDERGRRQEGLSSEKIKITENLKTQYKVFLKNLFNSLTELRKDPKTGLLNPDFNATALAGTSRMHEKHLYFLLTDKDGKLDDAKVEAYLKDPEHIMLVEEILEDHMRLKMFGLGLAAHADPRGSRTDVFEDAGKISIDVDQGVMNKAFEDYVMPWLSANNLVGGRHDNDRKYWWTRFTKIVTGAAAAGMIAGPIGASAGVVAGAAAGVGVIGAELFLANLFKRGVHIDKKWCVQGLASIKGDVATGIPPNKSEAEYLKAVVGIDVDDYDIDLTTDLLVHKGTKTVNREKLLGETMGLMYTRMQYHQEIGVDLKNVDAMLEQGILETDGNLINVSLLGKNLTLSKDSALALEQTRARSKARIVEIYITNGGSFDRYPITQPDRAIEVTRRLRILADARVQYMNEIIARDVQKEKLAREVANEAKADEDIKEKIDARTKDDGRLVIEVRGKIQEQVDDLTGQKEMIQREGMQLEKYKYVRKEVDSKEKDVNDFLLSLGIEKTNLPTGFTATNQEDFEKSAQEILRQMLEENKSGFFTLKIGEVAFGPDTIIAQTEAIKRDRAAELKVQDDLLPPSEQGLADLENAKDTAEEIYKAQYGKYIGFDNLIKGWQDLASNAARSNKMSAAEITATISMAEAKTVEAKREREALYIELFTGDTSTSPPIKSLLAKKNEAISFYAKAKKVHEELVIKVADEKVKIESKYKAKEDVLEAHKEDVKSAATELKQKILARDTAETAARKSETEDSDIKAANELVVDYSKQIYLLLNFKDGAGAPVLTDADLRTQSVVDIMKKINSAHAVPGNINPGAWPESQNSLPIRREQVLHAVIEARARAIAYISSTAVNNEHRKKAMDGYVADIDKKLLILEGEKVAVSESFKTEVAQLKEAQNLLKRQTEMLGSNAFAMEFILSTAPGPDFAMPMHSSLDPAVSTQEKNIAPVSIDGINYEFGNTERAYFVLLDMVTGYMSKGSSLERGKEFEKWSKALPPNEMARIVCDHLLRIPVIPGVTMNMITPVLTDYVKKGQIGPENVINFITSASREKVRKARALK